MDTIRPLLDLVLHLDKSLNSLAGTLGPWLYVVLFAIIFAETGLVIAPFLPVTRCCSPSGPWPPPRTRC